MIGLPNLPAFATEQREPSEADLDDLPASIQSVLGWLDRIACARQQHRTTTEYQNAVRRSGVAHGQSGISATEQETRAAIRKAKYDLRTAKGLAKEHRQGRLTENNSRKWQKQLLEAYWNGSLAQKVIDVTSGGSRDTMCRTPSLASTAQT